jgi:Fe-S-cluster containining protein
MNAKFSLRWPPELEALMNRDGVTAEEVIQTVRRHIPTGSRCRTGCHECCGPVPFCEYEWSRIPGHLKQNLHIHRVEMDWPVIGHVLLPLPLEVVRKKLRRKLRHFKTLSQTMRLGPEMGVACPFEIPAGCAIYQERPIVCRLFAAVDNPMLTCSHGVHTSVVLPAEIGYLMIYISQHCCED